MSEICFPLHEGLPGDSNPPDMDGLVEPEIGLPAEPVEAGWTGSQRVTYGGGSSVPIMVFQGVKERTADFIYLSFIVRFDQAFDENDAIVLLLRDTYGAPPPTNHTAATRRIHIFPNFPGVGAGPASQPADVPLYELRKNRPVRATEFFKWNGVSWAPAAVTNTSVTLKCRSWVTGTGANKNWSLEVKLPTTAALGGDWINLGAEFGFFYDLIRVCGTGACEGGAGAAINEFFSAQFSWPTGRTLSDPASGPLPTLKDYEVPASWLGKAHLGSSASCRGVKFANGNNSIGRVLGGALVGTISSQTTVTNTLRAQVVNDGATPANGVQATFRLANWGIGPADVNLWSKVRADAVANNGNPSVPPANLAAGGGTANLDMRWTLNAAESASYQSRTHQCMWVTLDSNQSAIFSESSERRNMDFVSASTFEEDAEISAKGYPAPKSGPDQEFLLLTTGIPLFSIRPYDGWTPRDTKRGATQDGPVVNQRDTNLPWILTEIYERWGKSVGVVSSWVWIVNGYRKTAETLTLDGKRHRIYDFVGSFGYVAEHNGLVNEWAQDISVPGMPPSQTPGAYRVSIPDGGVAKIRVKLEAKESIPCSLAFVLGLLGVIWEQIKKLLGK